MMRCLGAELREGDTIERFGGMDTIVSLTTYDGPLAHLWEGKARIATFARLGAMTIEPRMEFVVRYRRETSPPTEPSRLSGGAG